MAAAQEWLRANPPPPQYGKGNNTSAFTAAHTERSRTTPGAMFGQQQQQQQQQQQTPPFYRQQQPRRHRQRGTPGLVAYSRSSDELVQGTTNVALSPVMRPGATSFSSVASAFDFQHHLGSDPASELLVLKHVLTRECLLSQLEAVCGQLRKRFQLSPATATADITTARLRQGNDDCCYGVVNLLSRIRDATAAVIEAISVWRKDMAGNPPPAFVWHGDNYLLKVTNDMNFLAGVQPLVDTLKMHPARFCRNPLMLPQTLDEQRRDGELCENGVDDNVPPGAEKRRHLYQVAQVLLDEESLESERDSLRQELSRSASTLPSRGETSLELRGRYGYSQGVAGYRASPCAATSSVRRGGAQTIDGRSCSYLPSSFACGRDPAEDYEALRRQQRLSTWYEEARSQLVSLSTNPADEEYFLSSRRFWSKEELGDTGNGSSPPPPHRRPPGTLTRGGKRSAFTVAAASGRRGSDGSQRSMTERLPDGRGDERVDLFGKRLPSRQQRELPPAHQSRRLQDLRADGQAGRTAAEGAPQNQGGDYEQEGGADVWSRPDRFGGGSSAALLCLTVDDIEQILRTVDPLPATVAVCAAVVFLLAPEDQQPVDFLWPQGFDAVALPAEDFLWRLHETSGSTASSAKARFLAPVLQREYLLPEEIERDAGHAVAGLCAWALEELHVCEEFAEWSERALEPWYETQLVPDQSDVPKSHEVADREVKLVYKALHKLPNLRGAYVISLFEGKDAEGGLIVRAFDRAKRDAFWLSLSKNKIASLGGNAAQSPATLAAALSLRLKMKLDFVSSTKRLVLPSAKKVESSSDKKKRDRFSRRETKSVSGVSERDGDGAGEEKTGATSREADDVEASPSPPSTEDEPVTTAPECPAQTLSQPRRSHPPPTRGSKSGDLGPLVEKDAYGSECSAEDFKDTRSASSSSDVKSPAASTVEVVPKENSARSPPPDKTEKAPTASEATIECQENPAQQTTNATEAELALSGAPSEPGAKTSSDGGEGKDPRTELGEVEMEESGSYVDDFAPDNDEGKMSESQVGVEETGSYVDDFADDGEEAFDEGGHEEGESGNQKASNGESFAGAEVLGTGVGVAALDVVGGSGGSTTGFTEEPIAAEEATAIDLECVSALPERTDTDVVGVHETAASELDGARLDGAHCSSDTPRERVHTPRESPAVSADDELRDGDNPQRSLRENENTGLNSSGERFAAQEGEEGEEEEEYEQEYLEGGDERAESAKPEVVESIRAGVAPKTEESGSTSVEFTGAGDEDAPTTQTQQSEPFDEVLDGVEGETQGEETGPAQHTQPDKNDRRPSSEAANNLTVPDETTADGSDGGCGVGNAELVVEGAGQEVRDNSQQELVAEADEHRARAPPLEPVPTPIVVDSLNDEGYGSEFDENPTEEFQDDFETSEVDEASPVSEGEAATVAAATDSVCELGSGGSEVDVTETGAQSVSCTVAVAENGSEERTSSTELAKPAVIEQNPSPNERRRSSEGEAPFTNKAPEDNFEESYDDDTGENDTVTSAGGGESSYQAPEAGKVAPASEPGNSLEGIPRSASLPGQEIELEVPTGGDSDGEKFEADGAVAVNGSAVGLTRGGSSITEDGDFEEDFEEEFEEDIEEDAAPAEPNEEDMAADSVVGTGQNLAIFEGEETGSVQNEDEGVRIVSGSEVSNPPANTATSIGGGGEGEEEVSLGNGDGREEPRLRAEEAVEAPPPTEQAEVNRGSEGRRKSAHQITAAAEVVEVEPPGEFGDDFEDDFEEEDDTKDP